MALVQGYSSDEDEDISISSVPAPSTNRTAPNRSLQAAPEVSLEVTSTPPLEQQLTIRIQCN